MIVNSGFHDCEKFYAAKWLNIKKCYGLWNSLGYLHCWVGDQEGNENKDGANDKITRSL